MILLDKEVKVFRLQSLGGFKSGYTTLTTSLEAAIQPASDTEVASFGGSSEKLYKIYMDVDRNIQEGDQIRDYYGNIYKVESGGIENRNDGFIADHLDLTVRRVNK